MEFITEASIRNVEVDDRSDTDWWKPRLQCISMFS